MQQFDTVFARASVGDLQNLLGAPALKLINLLEPRSTSMRALRDVVIGLYGYDGLLLNPRSRELVLDLLPASDAEQLARMLTGKDEKNPYAALRTVTFRSQRQKQTLFEFFGVASSTPEVIQEQPDYEYIEPGYPLFSHQLSAARSIAECLNTHPYRVLLHMPTGAGKTRTAMNVITDHLKQHNQTVVIWLAFSEELCIQAADEFQRAWQQLGNRPLNMYRFWGQHTLDASELEDGIVIAGLAKTYSAAMNSAEFISQLGRRASLVVIDEAHSAIAPTYRFILELLLVFRPSAALLGLTATPGRTWADIDVDQELADFFYRQKVTLKINGYANPVDYLVKEQYLAQAQYNSLYNQHGIELSASDERELMDALDIPPSILQRLADDEVRNLLIIQKIEELATRHKRIIVFAATVEHSDLLAAILRMRGIEARSVSSRSSSSERQSAIESFKSKDDTVRVLCNYGVLTTGFDAPQTSAAVIARPTKSLVLYSQMVGRAIRGSRAGGNSHAEIVSVVDPNLPGFGSVADAFNNWEDIWE
jgi:DNA repair protein RadD